MRARRTPPLTLLLATGLLWLVGCATVTQRTLPSPVVSMDRDSLDPAVVKAKLDPGIMIGEKEGVAYRIGPGDTLMVAVYGHTELSLSHYAGTSGGGQNPRASGLVVDNDGSVQFPLIGSVQVAGKDSGQLRVFLEQELGRYIKDPKVTVQVMYTGTIRYYLLGEFTTPGLHLSDRPLNLLEAISLGGSVNLKSASLRTAYIARQGHRLPINFRRLFRQGDLTQNIRLRTGDVIVVPDNTAEVAYVFGGIGTVNSASGTAKGGPVQFRNGRLDIVQALAQAGFGSVDRAFGRLGSTHVIRSEGDQAELYVVNVAKILNGEAAPFWLMPGDVVLVPKSAGTPFAILLSQLVPALQAVGAALNPFVQIKYLQR